MQQDTPFRSFFSGCAAGLVADATLYPLDSIKTRLQHPELSKQGLIKTIGSLRGLYRGIGSVMSSSAPNAGLFFLTFEGIRNIIDEQKTTTGNVMRELTACTGGEIVACLIRVPGENIKIKMQCHKEFHSSFSCLKWVYTNQGIRGLLNGFSTTIVRELPFVWIQFPLWDYMKRTLSDKQGYTVTLSQSATCGAISGGIAASVTTPFDVVKTRIMLNMSTDIKTTNSVSETYDVFKSIYKNEGVSKLYSGMVPRTLWMSLGGFVFFGTYSFSQSIFRTIRKKEE